MVKRVSSCAHRSFSADIIIWNNLHFSHCWGSALENVLARALCQMTVLFTQKCMNKYNLWWNSTLNFTAVCYSIMFYRDEPFYNILMSFCWNEGCLLKKTKQKQKKLMERHPIHNQWRGFMCHLHWCWENVILYYMSMRTWVFFSEWLLIWISFFSPSSPSSSLKSQLLLSALSLMMAMLHHHQAAVCWCFSSASLVHVCLSPVIMAFEFCLVC